jgi:hypothetical protein
MEDLSQLIRDYLAYGESESPELFDACNRIIDIVQKSPEEGWEIVQLLEPTAPSSARSGPIRRCGTRAAPTGRPWPRGPGQAAPAAAKEMERGWTEP